MCVLGKEWEVYVDAQIEVLLLVGAVSKCVEELTSAAGTHNAMAHTSKQTNSGVHPNLFRTA